MAQQQLIMAIGRIERALSRLEQVPMQAPVGDGNSELFARHERLKAETRAAINEIDDLIVKGEN